MIATSLSSGIHINSTESPMNICLETRISLAAVSTKPRFLVKLSLCYPAVNYHISTLPRTIVTLGRPLTNSQPIVFLLPAS